MRDGHFPGIAGEVVERDRLGHRLSGSHFLSNSAIINQDSSIEVFISQRWNYIIG